MKKIPPKYRKIFLLLIVIIYFLYQFVPREISFFYNISESDVALIVCYFMPDEEVDPSLMYRYVTIEDADIINRILEVSENIRMRPEIPLELPDHVNRPIDVSFYDADGKYLGGMTVKRPNQVYIKEKNYMVYNKKTVSQLSSFVHEYVAEKGADTFSILPPKWLYEKKE